MFGRPQGTVDTSGNYAAVVAPMLIFCTPMSVMMFPAARKRGKIADVTIKLHPAAGGVTLNPYVPEISGAAMDHRRPHLSTS